MPIVRSAAKSLPTCQWLAVNLKSAKVLGLTVPPSLLVTATG